MSTPVNSLSSIMPPELKGAETRRIDDVLDMPIIIHRVTVKHGERGSYLQCLCSEESTDQRFYVNTGAAQPVEVLTWAVKNRKLPVSATFRKFDQSYTIE